MPAPILFRRRLINQIEDAGNQIVYIHGPAGYGKSIVARQWVESQAKPTVWFEGFSSMDANELFKLLIEKMREAIPSLAKKLEEFELSEELTLKTIRDFLKILEKDRTQFNLVIDNAESIRRAHNEFSRYLVSEMPANVRLVLLTQTSPRTSFIKEHGLDRFTVISPIELNFNIEELTQLARQISEQFTSKQINEIYRLTEGWPAGVQIALSQVELTGDFDEALTFMRSKGKQQFLIASQRILANLEKDEYQLLSSLALLDEIDAQAALSISDDVDAVRKLTVLSQESMVVTQTGFAPPKFTINPLIRSALVEELQSESNFASKSERVLSYLLERGEIRALTRVLLELGAVNRLAGIVRDPKLAEKIDSSIQESVARGAINDLRSWVLVAKSVPELGDAPSMILNFYIELLSGNFSSAESHLQALKDFLNGPKGKISKNVLPDVSIMESIALFARGRLNDSFDLAIKAWEKAAKALGETRHHQITYLQLALWGAVIIDDDEKVRKISKILDSDAMKVIAKQRNSIIMSMRALIAAHEGRFTETRNQLILPLTPSSQDSYAGFFGAYGVLLAESMLLGESGDIEGSLKILQGAQEKALEASNFPMAVALLGRLSYHHVLIGKTQEALDALSMAREIVVKNLLGNELNDAIDIWETRVRYLLQDSERTQELLRRAKPSYLIRAFEAGLYINSNPDKALEIIESFDLRNPRQQLTYHLFKAHIFKDSPVKQLDEVRKAVEVGSKHGYFNHFLTQRSDVIQAYISLAAEYPTSFNERLARAAGERLNEMMVGNQDNGQALTRREADILRHLATGLPIRDIANNLNISKNTIKTHLRNLYRKLGAEDRRDAVEKGKRLLKV